MPYDSLKNLAYGVVLVPPTPPNLGTSLTLASGHGGRFNPPPFQISIWPFGVPADPTNCEIVRCTAKAGDVLTIVRAQEGSAARTILNGDQVAQAITGKWMTDFINDMIATMDFKINTAIAPLANKSYVDAQDLKALTKIPKQWPVQTAATPVVIDTDQYDQVYVYQQLTALAFGNTTGTAAEGQALLVRVRDNGVAIPITWSSNWMTATSVPLPTATVASKTLSLGFRFNGLYAKWQMLALAQEP